MRAGPVRYSVPSLYWTNWSSRDRLLRWHTRPLLKIDRRSPSLVRAVGKTKGEAVRLSGILLMSAALLAQPVTAWSQGKKYDTGATDTEIKIGQTIMYSGAASAA